MQFFSNEYHAVEDVECIGSILASVGEKNARLRHDSGGHHAFAPVVDLVVMEAAFSQPEKLDHIGAAESDGIAELALKLPLIEGYLHEGHILVTVGSSWQPKTWNAFNHSLCLDSLPIGAPEYLHHGTGDFLVGGGSEKAEGVKTLLYPDEINVFNNNRQERK